jgi:hypothetical protein
MPEKKDGGMITIVVADKGYGIPELKKELGKEYEIVSAEEGMDRAITKLLEYSLFGGSSSKLIVAENTDIRDGVIAALAKSTPPAPVVLVVHAGTELQKKKWKSLGFDIKELRLSLVIKEKDSGEAFTLARVIASGDPKASFVLWKNMEQKRVSIDATIPALWWQLKKSYGYARGQEKQKVLVLMKSVVEMVHESRRGISSLPVLFERMLLSLRK